MAENRLLSSPGVRVATVLLGALCAATLVLHWSEPSLQSSGVFAGFAIGSGLLALLGLIYSFEGLYRNWMRFAVGLQKVAALLLFGICYLLVVPVFFVIVRLTDPLKQGRRQRNAKTLWVEVRRGDRTSDSFQRMG
jgi:hypothetical protein